MTTTTADRSSSKPDAKDAPAAPPPDTVTLTIDGRSVTVKKGTLLVEAAKQLGDEIPVFCYHPKLKPVGACRMCLVEIEKMPRLQTACTTPVGEGMVVRTNSQKATDGQESVISLLLANHPLDCPVCDKGGECPLQDNTFEHGRGVSHYEEYKRHNDKAFELSDRIVLDRERCILCYRCVRFHDEVPGDRALAVIDRGNHGSIGVAEGEAYDSPLQGNVIDICPVGALTSRQYRFRSRPWDLKKAKGIANDDPVGSNLWIDSRDGRVLRLRPRENLGVNDAWLADKTRFDTMPAERSERLGTPYVRKDGKLVATTWFDGVRRAGTMVRNNKTGVLVSASSTNEALGVLAQGQITDRVNVWPRLSTWKTTDNGTAGALQSLGKSKSVVVVGCDPFYEAPVLGLWIRRALVPFTNGGQPTGGGGKLVVVGPDNGLFRDSSAWLKTNDVKAGLKQLVLALEGDAAASADAVTAASFLKERPASIVAGAALSTDAEGQALLARLHKALGCTPSESFAGGVDLVSNAVGARQILGDRAHVYADSADGVLKAGLDTLIVAGDVPHVAGFPLRDAGGARVVWLTATLTEAALAEVPDFVDVVLPLAHTYEQAGSFTNISGTHQGFDAGGIPPGGKEKAKADWEVLALLARELGAAIPHDLKGLRAVLAADHAFARGLPNNRNTPTTSLTVM